MHFNPLLTTSILALTTSATAWNNQDSYDLYTRDVNGLYGRDYIYDDENLYARDAEPEFLDWDIDTLHPRDAYELGLETATQYLAARDAYPYPSAPMKGAAPAKPGAGSGKAATPAKPAAMSPGAQQAKAKHDLSATASKQKLQLMKDEKALSQTLSKESKMGMSSGLFGRAAESEWDWEY